MNRKIGNRPAGTVSSQRPHLGDMILARYRDRITCGMQDLEEFHLIDELRKPVMSFIFVGNKKIILEVYYLLSKSPYAFSLRTKKGFDIWRLPENGSRNAYVYISRFPHLIKFIEEHETSISADLWGLLFGYPLPEVHQFTYDWEARARTEGTSARTPTMRRMGPL